MYLIQEQHTTVCSYRVVLKQNEKLTDVEEKYKHLYGKTASLLEMEEEVLKVSKKVTRPNVAWGYNVPATDSLCISCKSIVCV